MISDNTIQDIFDIAVINCHAINLFVINAMSQIDNERAPQTRPLIPLTNIVVLFPGP